MKNRKIDEKMTKQIVIDKELHKLLKTEASRVEKSLKELTEMYLAESVGVDITKNV